MQTHLHYKMSTMPYLRVRFSTFSEEQIEADCQQWKEEGRGSFELLVFWYLQAATADDPSNWLRRNMGSFYDRGRKRKFGRNPL